MIGNNLVRLLFVTMRQKLLLYPEAFWAFYGSVWEIIGSGGGPLVVPWQWNADKNSISSILTVYRKSAYRLRQLPPSPAYCDLKKRGGGLYCHWVLLLSSTMSQTSLYCCALVFRAPLNVSPSSPDKSSVSPLASCPLTSRNLLLYFDQHIHIWTLTISHHYQGRTDSNTVNLFHSEGMDLTCILASRDSLLGKHWPILSLGARFWVEEQKIWWLWQTQIKYK